MKSVSKIIKLCGIALVGVAIIGRMLAAFDYALVINNASLPLVDNAVAISLLVVGIIFYLTGSLMVKKFGDLDAPQAIPPTLDMADPGFVFNALKKTRRRNMVMAIFMGIFGLFMIILPLTLNEGTGVIIGLTIFGVLCLVIAGFGFSQFSKLRNIETSEIYRLIMHSPQQITGLNVQIFQGGIGKLGQSINAAILVDKKQKCVLQVNETELGLLTQYLLKQNPKLLINGSTSSP